MRYTILIVLYYAISQCAVSAHSLEASRDSLLRLLPLQKEAQARYATYRNLADISFETSEEKTFLRLMYEEAQKGKNKKQIVDALGELANIYQGTNLKDSASYYIKMIEDIEPCVGTQCWLAYLHMRKFSKELLQVNNTQALEKELQKRMSQRIKEPNIYSEIEHAFSIGIALHAQGKFKEAIPYMQTAIQLADSLPFYEGYHIRRFIMGLLSNLYSATEECGTAISITQRKIDMHTSYYDLIKDTRPFYNINTYYIQCYSALLLNMRMIAPEKVPMYLQKIITLCKDSQNAYDKYNSYLALNNYYLQMNDCKNAIIANDSLIKYAHQVAPENIPGLYEINSRIYEAMEKYQEALSALRTAYVMNDSIISLKSAEQLNQLQVEYNVDKLNYENSQLEIKNKRILLVCLSAVLLLSIGVSVHLYKSLKKERRMKATLRILKTKAEESENMKTAFVNSICHEIRTPLNSIVGFSDLIFDTSIDEELRKSFPTEIQKHTHQLTSLINSILEVSNLKVSDEKLPCTPTDVKAICYQETDRLKEYIKPGINTRIELPEEDITISCNGRYLAMVLEHLLNNSDKFTESGEIVLHVDKDKLNNKLLIRVSDTGCGIPPEKRKEVFERFTKLDTYKPGNGLGLYLCQLIITRLSGEISIDPDYNRKGTSIIITLPVD